MKRLLMVLAMVVGLATGGQSVPAFAEEIWDADDTGWWESDNWGEDDYGWYDEDFGWNATDDDWDSWYGDLDGDWKEFDDIGDGDEFDIDI